MSILKILTNYVNQVSNRHDMCLRPFQDKYNVRFPRHSVNY
jgi:hypothetical protein